MESGVWVDELDRLLRAAGQILEQDVTAYGERRDQAVAARKYWLADTYQKVIRNLTQRELLGVLANRNVLPKYGFPVDTVELRIPQDGGGVAGQLELTRDLSAAVHEYAPGAEIVAGGHLWASAGVYRLPDRELVSRHYTVCGTCGRYREATEPVDPTCTACGATSTAAPRRYVEPVYGFVAARGPQRRPGRTPPRRSWSGADGMPSLLLFDTTPGGAGNVIRIGEHLEPVVEAALARVGGCECGPESSCHACLRTFRNERFHELLSRGEAVVLLDALAGRSTS
ncbi:DUF1998 domain-containing protein [Streptomyces griseomycini]|uniref:MrfA-like Zn-binding domain-containing protein n=1 Tax=Streptomyces griseomycini TaxID=66895 RepID=A0A7W7PVC2_9ACTN|nr:DUF1998 domain-containing protein [Streptomyces griseomycini]MBB4901985.1 hypothetical protein [Streptomyces griseomycini]GGQ18020.1 hypothetical protein GCM10010266_46610 [Streptomyces griseomycini]GGR41676.1 hypothetical protein GCM10015536_54420 [Streptomyces griseomycini]